MKGIGPYYAKKIVNFREKLGGFSSVEQVGTTYQIPDTVFRKIYDQLLPSPIFRKLAINTASIDSLKAHPYLKGRQAQAIFNYRMNHGVYKSWEDLKKVKVLSMEQLEQIKPYLEY